MYAESINLKPMERSNSILGGLTDYGASKS